MPRKVFVAGEILTAADVNTNLMDQSVMVFDDATARATAIPTPVEGMVTYLKDDDEVTVFDGSAFKAVGPGQILQVVQGTFSTTESTTSATFQNTSLTVSITPSSTSSKVHLICAVSTRTLRTGEANSGNSDFAIDRNGGTLVAQGRLSNVAQGAANYSLDTVTTLSALDSPSSASSVTYTWQHRTETGTTTVTSFLGNRTGFLIAMEVAG